MTKAENQAAAKAYHRERMQKHRDEAHAQAVAADLEGLRLTGERRTLHAQNHSIG